MNTIILTGGSGFIGSHVLLALCRFFPKYKIVNLDAGTYAARPAQYITAPKNLVREKLDIRDQLGVHRVYEKHKPIATIHMAAESHVCRSISGPRDFMTTNCMGTFNLLEAHHSNKCGRFLHVSTDEVFGEIREGSFTEESPMQPRSPYSASKASSDMFVRAYFHTYDVDTITVNMSNVYGPNQHEEKLVPRTISNILLNRPVIVHGQGDHIRDWLWCRDAVAGIMAAFENGVKGETYCLGGRLELKNIDMVKAIIRCVMGIMGPIDYKIVKTDDRPTDDFRYSLDCTKAQHALGWEPHPELFEENLMETVEWHVRGIIARAGDGHGGGTQG